MLLEKGKKHSETETSFNTHQRASRERKKAFRNRQTGRGEYTAYRNRQTYRQTGGHGGTHRKARQKEEWARLQNARQMKEQ